MIATQNNDSPGTMNALRKIEHTMTNLQSTQLTANSFQQAMEKNAGAMQKLAGLFQEDAKINALHKTMETNSEYTRKTFELLSVDFGAQTLEERSERSHEMLQGIRSVEAIRSRLNEIRTGLKRNEEVLKGVHASFGNLTQLQSAGQSTASHMGELVQSVQNFLANVAPLPDIQSTIDANTKAIQRLQDMVSDRNPHSQGGTTASPAAIDLQQGNSPDAVSAPFSFRSHMPPPRIPPPGPAQPNASNRPLRPISTRRQSSAELQTPVGKRTQRTESSQSPREASTGASAKRARSNPDGGVLLPPAYAVEGNANDGMNAMEEEMHLPDRSRDDSNVQRSPNEDSGQQTPTRASRYNDDDALALTLDDFVATLDAFHPEAADRKCKATDLPQPVLDRIKPQLTPFLSAKAYFDAIAPNIRTPADCARRKASRTNKSSSVKLEMSECLECKQRGQVCVRKARNVLRPVLIPMHVTSMDERKSWEDPDMWAA